MQADTTPLLTSRVALETLLLRGNRVQQTSTIGTGHTRISRHSLIRIQDQRPRSANLTTRRSSSRERQRNKSERRLRRGLRTLRSGTRKRPHLACHCKGSRIPTFLRRSWRITSTISTVISEATYQLPCTLPRVGYSSRESSRLGHRTSKSSLIRRRRCSLWS